MLVKENARVTGEIEPVTYLLILTTPPMGSAAPYAMFGFILHFLWDAVALVVIVFSDARLEGKAETRTIVVKNYREWRR
jgi:hypothetical protein